MISELSAGTMVMRDVLGMTRKPEYKEF